MEYPRAGRIGDVLCVSFKLELWSHVARKDARYASILSVAVKLWVYPPLSLVEGQIRGFSVTCMLIISCLVEEPCQLPTCRGSIHPLSTSALMVAMHIFLLFCIIKDSYYAMPILCSLSAVYDFGGPFFRRKGRVIRWRVLASWKPYVCLTLVDSST